MGTHIETSAPSDDREPRTNGANSTDHVASSCYLAPFLRGSSVEVRHRGHKRAGPRHRHLQRRELRVVRFAWLGLLVLAHHRVLVSTQRGKRGCERCCCSWPCCSTEEEGDVPHEREDLSHVHCCHVPHRVRLRCVSSGWHADYADRCKQANSRSNEQFLLFLHRRIMVFDGEPRLLHGGLLFDICLLLSQELGPQGIQELLYRQACQVGRPLHPFLNAAGSNGVPLVPSFCRGTTGVQLH